MKRAAVGLVVAGAFLGSALVAHALINPNFTPVQLVANCDLVAVLKSRE